jgi:hypothetical protein
MLRNQAFAHSSAEFRQPQVARWPRSDGGASYGLGFRNPPYDVLLKRLVELRSLICAVEDGINASVRECEARFERLYASTPPPTIDAPGV